MTEKAIEIKSSYVCYNCNHHWTARKADMVEDDACPICTVINNPEISEIVDEDIRDIMRSSVKHRTAAEARLIRNEIWKEKKDDSKSWY